MVTVALAGIMYGHPRVVTMTTMISHLTSCAAPVVAVRLLYLIAPTKMACTRIRATARVRVMWDFRFAPRRIPGCTATYTITRGTAARLPRVPTYTTRYKIRQSARAVALGVEPAAANTAIPCSLETSPENESATNIRRAGGSKVTANACAIIMNALPDRIARLTASVVNTICQIVKI